MTVLRLQRPVAKQVSGRVLSLYESTPLNGSALSECHAGWRHLAGHRRLAMIPDVARDPVDHAPRSGVLVRPAQHHAGVIVLATPEC